eukprot:scaffold32921_cov73-Phaeocystis_antarctica.AAC.3
MSEGSRPTYPRGIEAGAPSVPDSAMKRWAASWYPSMTSQFMTSRSIVALLTVTELSRFAHSASGPLAEDAAGAGASVAAERRAIRKTDNRTSTAGRHIGPTVRAARMLTYKSIYMYPVQAIETPTIQDAQIARRASWPP